MKYVLSVKPRKSTWAHIKEDKFSVLAPFTRIIFSIYIFVCFPKENAMISLFTKVQKYRSTGIWITTQKLKRAWPHNGLKSQSFHELAHLVIHQVLFSTYTAYTIPTNYEIGLIWINLSIKIYKEENKNIKS